MDFTQRDGVRVPLSAEDQAQRALDAEIVAAAASEPPPAPASCTKLGLKRAFSEMGLWEKVKGFIASDPDRQEEWDLATELKLTDPIMVAAIQAFAVSGIPIDPVQLASRANALVA